MATAILLALALVATGVVWAWVLWLQEEEIIDETSDESDDEALLAWENEYEMAEDARHCCGKY